MSSSTNQARVEIKAENASSSSTSSSNAAPPAPHDDPVAARAAAEKAIGRNPHPDFKSVESSRPPFPNDRDAGFQYNQTVSPDWVPGSGANHLQPSPAPHREIDPYGPQRKAVDNYKLLISGIIPRPIGFISTVNKETNTTNLAPFSYTTMVNHDPPIFCVGFSGGKGQLKDTARNLLENGECTINIISEWFAEAANFTAVNAPPGVSEWTLSGLTPANSTHVKPARVLESAFSVEGKLVAHHEWTSPASGNKTGVTCLVEGVNFWVREDVVNKDGNQIDAGKLRPVSRLGGITYGRTVEGFELPRPDWEGGAKNEYERLNKEKEQKAESVGLTKEEGEVVTKN